MDKPLEDALKNHPPNLKKKVGSSGDGGAIETPSAAREAIVAARKAAAEAEPDWDLVLSTIAAVPDAMLQESRSVNAQMKALVTKAKQQSAKHPMDDARASNPDGAARYDAMLEKFNLTRGDDAAPAAKVHPRLATSKLAKAQAAQAEEQHADAYDLYSWLVERTPDSEQGQAAQEAISAYQADEQLMATITAQRNEAKAQAMLKTAISYAKAERDDLAIKTYRQILDAYPKTKSAAQAHAALEKLGEKP